MWWLNIEFYNNSTDEDIAEAVKMANDTIQRELEFLREVQSWVNDGKPRMIKE